MVGLLCWWTSLATHQNQPPIPALHSYALHELHTYLIGVESIRHIPQCCLDRLLKVVVVVYERTQQGTKNEKRKGLYTALHQRQGK